MAQGNIPQYDPTMPQVRVDERGIEATSQAANRVNRIYTELGSSVERTGRLAGQDIGSGISDLGKAVEDSMYHKELSHGIATDAQGLMGLTQKWNKILQSADPHDATVGQKFMQGPVQEYLDSFQKGFTTEKGVDWANHRSMEFQQHFAATTAHGLGMLSAKAAQADIETLGNSLSNTVYLDPGRLPFVLRSLKDHTEDILKSYPNLQGEELAAVRETLPQKLGEAIVRSYAKGSISQSSDPEGTARAISAKYPEYIKGDEAQSLALDARRELRFMHAEQRANEAETRRQNITAFHSAANQFELSLTKEDPNTHEIVPNNPGEVRKALSNLANMPDADPGRISTLVTKVEHDGILRDETTRSNIAKASVATQARLFEETRSGKITDPSAYEKEYADNKGTTLTWEALQQLKNNFYADKSVTGEPIAQSRKQYLTANEGNLDPARVVANLKSGAGSVAINQADQALRRAEADYRSKGKDPQELYAYDENGHSPADTIIQKFKVPLSALPTNLQTMLGNPNPIQGAPVRPPALGGIGALGWSPAKRLWFDQATGEAYNEDGTRSKANDYKVK